MKKNHLILALIAVVAFSFTACRKSPYKGFDKHKDGYYYKFVEVNKDNNMPVKGDLVSLYLTLSIEGDSMPFFPPQGLNIPSEGMRLAIDDMESPADLYDVIQTMHLKDSAEFILDADTFFYYMAPELRPANVEDGAKLHASIRLISIMPKAEFQKLVQQQRQEEEAMLAMLQNQEDSLMKVYLSKNKITVKPTASGLYFINKKAGSGIQAEKGKLVKVHYTGYLLDGSKFDSSIDRGEPLEFKLGEGQVIKGWDEGIAMMKVGGKAKLIVPSKLGYGDRGAGQTILPYSPLVFDVELIDVK